MTTQITNTVLLVSPDSFGFNEETALSNTFQHKSDKSDEEIRMRALQEFNNVVGLLKQHDIRTIILPSPQDNVPDAVFPNNWMSTDVSGNLIVYSMFSENRRKEKQIEEVKVALEKEHFVLPRVINLQAYENAGIYLEGTGSMVLDRINFVLYAAISERTDMRLLEYFGEAFGYKIVQFHANDMNDAPIYHTNVMMNLGEGFIVTSLESIPEVIERENMVYQLEKNSIEIIDITLEQVSHFCGNILHLVSSTGQKKIIMSTNAFNHFTEEQLEQFKRYGEIIHTDVSTIEEIGGGGIRCMLAEIFLPMTANN